MSVKLQFDLPDVADECDLRLEALCARLTTFPGFESAHAIERTAKYGVRLCVHFDPDVVDLTQANQTIIALSRQLVRGQGVHDVRLAGVDVPVRAFRLAQQLRHVIGVSQVKETETGWLQVVFDRARTSEDALRSYVSQIEQPIDGAEDAKPQKHQEEDRPLRSREWRAADKRRSGAQARPHSQFWIPLIFGALLLVAVEFLFLSGFSGE